MEKVGVMGGGIMGSGIAQVALQSGYHVVLYDNAENALRKGIQGIEKNLARLVEKEKLTTQQTDEIFFRLAYSTDMSALKECDAVIEAIAENIDIKREVLYKLGKICKPETIFATNTSSLSITEMGSFSGRAEQFVGMHFFNPVPIMKLIEIVRGAKTSQATLKTAQELAKRFGHETIEVKEAPLFAVNRILVPMLNEAIFVLGEGIASKEDIDKGMKLGTNQPIGPLALADMVGLDTLLAVVNSLYNETKDSKYRPAPLLVKMVRAGMFGRKNGEGFYTYK
ncbi:3-hydroxyacyl-CoA dehydrogenase NAD-binding domain-containing protein [Lachnospiraceae bacterium ZAX-1]